MVLNNKAGFKESEYVGIKDEEKPAKLERKYSIGGAKAEKLKGSSACVKFWVIVATILMLSMWFLLGKLAIMDGERELQHHQFPYPPPLPLERIYQNNGYLMVSCNGGLNQMRTSICDMVVVARYLNLTLIVPELDHQSYWSDNSEFADIFDVDHFIVSLRDEVRILKELPPEQNRKAELESVYSMYPLVLASLRYYLNRVLPRIRRHEIVRFTLTDFRLANNGLPEELQKLRCRVNFRALKYTSTIEATGRKIVRILRQRGPFLVINLRYEKDMLAFTGCTEGCSEKETKELTEMRYARPRWKHMKIDAKRSRQSGLCPLTPEETALVLQALGVDRNIQIYIASGDVHANNRRMKNLTAAYPNLVRKETILEPSDLRPFQNHSNQMAALDFIVAVESDTFIPTYGGNMARIVEGHRRYLGFKKTILPNRKLLVDLIDQYKNGNLNWDEFSQLVKASHVDRMGQPTRRVEKKPEDPKFEISFYSNPQECLPSTIS